MKILITGGNGYIASSLNKALSGEYHVDVIARQDVNLEDLYQVRSYFKHRRYDVVIHTAICGGSRLQEDTSDVFYKNLNMFYNILDSKNSFEKLITFGSGAEKLHTPYGMSKFFINQAVHNIPGCYNLRIYGVFDQNEKDTRFIKSCIMSCIKNQPINLIENKHMDFIYMKDLVEIVKFYLSDDNKLDKELDCCYTEKYTLLEIANLVNVIANKSVPIYILADSRFKKPYVSLSSTKLPIKTIGLEEGIKETYEIISKQLENASSQNS